MEIKGKVLIIGEVQHIGDTFKKRELILEYAENPSYPETVKFEAIQDKITLLDTINIGDELEVSFNIRGRGHTNKEGVTSYFNSLVVWRLSKLSSNGAKPTYVKPVDLNVPIGEDDTLPF